MGRKVTGLLLSLPLIRSYFFVQDLSPVRFFVSPVWRDRDRVGGYFIRVLYAFSDPNRDGIITHLGSLICCSSLLSLPPSVYSPFSLYSSVMSRSLLVPLLIYPLSLSISVLPLLSSFLYRGFAPSFCLYWSCLPLY